MLINTLSTNLTLARLNKSVGEAVDNHYSIILLNFSAGRAVLSVASSAIDHPSGRVIFASV
jgi:hypothetical protein